MPLQRKPQKKCVCGCGRELKPGITGRTFFNQACVLRAMMQDKQLPDLVGRDHLAQAILWAEAAAMVLTTWPNAGDLQFAGRCDACKADKALWSFVLPDGDHDARADHESCGYYCTACGFSNAGARLKVSKGE